MPRKRTDLEMLELKLMENPRFVEEYQKTKPFADIAMEIIRVRCEAGLSQKEFADKIGVKQPMIARIESFNTEGISLKTLQKIATAMGLTLKIEFLREAS